MAFTQRITFSDLSRLLEAVSTPKAVKKRDEFMSQYFAKVHKFREDFKNQNKDSVNLILYVYRRGVDF